jgi:hypothetical protein
MKDSRKGEALWSEWEGYDFPYTRGDLSLVFFTEEHVDIEHEVVKRALASTLQRDGIVHSLSEAFKLIDGGATTQGWAGSVGGDIYLTYCDEDGNSPFGDLIEDIKEITFVEVTIP